MSDIQPERPRGREEVEQISELLQRFMEHLRSRDNAEQTVKSYSSDLKLFAGWFHETSREELTPQSITPIDLREYKRYLLDDRGYKPATINRRLASISAFCKWAQEQGLADGNPCGDLYLEEGYMKVLGKGRKERIVPLGYTSQRALWKYVRRFRAEPALPTIDRVFLTRDGQPMKIDWLYKIVSRACRRAGIDGKRIGPHTCRHTFARQFLMNGGDLLTLQRILGHSSLDVVRLYVNLDTRDLLQQQRRHSPMDVLHSKEAP